MPLFIDLHEVDSETFSVEDAYRFHLKDLEVQQKHGVTYHKYWISIDEKLSFCLMEGPNKDACNAVHKESHGLTSCNIVELTDKEFNLYLGMGDKDQHDLARTPKGEVDVGFRTLVQTNITSFSKKSTDWGTSIANMAKKHFGTFVLQPGDLFISSFIYASDAVSFATGLVKFLASESHNLEFGIAVVTGKPVDINGSSLFEEAKLKLSHLNAFGKSGTVYIDFNTEEFIRKESNPVPNTYENTKVVSKNDFLFYEVLWETLDGQIPNPNFKSEHLCKKLGLSRAQAYRKIKLLTGMAPNELIREMRLRRSLEALKQNSKTVAEIAYYLGFNSPTYFTRVFRKRYEVLPTEFAKLSN